MKHSLIAAVVVAVSFSGVARAHGEDGHETPASTPALSYKSESSTWEIIQRQILDPNCTSCHSPGTSFARQSDLVLKGDAAYERLVDVVPCNRAAAADGLVRVSSTGGIPRA